jgi:acetyl-CoA acetyltransferase family protein
VESMSRAPWVLLKPEKGFPAGNSELFSTTLGWRMVNPDMPPEWTITLGESTEKLAGIHKIGREAQDAFALRSHQRALEAWKNGHFDAEVVPVGDVTQDEGPRADTTAEKLAQLRPIHGPGGIITAGNASSLNDGAAAVVLVSERYAERHGLAPMARVVAGASAGVAPEIMGIGPVPATRKVLERTGWSIGDVGAVELNEAFASQSLACMRDLDLDPQVVNADGGAIALGHPLGCSGTRITVTLLNRMAREGASRGLATMCVGVGQGTALLLEQA